LTEYSETYQFLLDVSGKMGAGVFCIHALIPESKGHEFNQNIYQRYSKNIIVKFFVQKAACVLSQENMDMMFKRSQEYVLHKQQKGNYN